MELTPDYVEMKKDFEEWSGTWTETSESVTKLDPQFMRAYTKLAAVRSTKRHLDSKTRELMFIAVDAAATHLYAPGVRDHVRRALRAGATVEEIMEVLELAATLGIHAMNIGVPILVEVLVEKGLRTGPAPLDARQQELKEKFTKARGYWHHFWDEMLELDPELFDAYTDFSSVPWRSGTLSPKVKEFVYIAFDTAATHLYVKGLKAHIENAIGYGATVGELLEIMEIATLLGMQAVAAAVPVLIEESNASGA